MAFRAPLFCIPGVTASADLSASQHRFVTIDSNGQAAVVSTQGAASVGVLQNKPSAAGQAAEIMHLGVTKVTAGGTVAKGAIVQSDNVGRAITAVKETVNTNDAGSTSDAVVGGLACGVALEGGASGSLITVLLVPLSSIPTTAA